MTKLNTSKLNLDSLIKIIFYTYIKYLTKIPMLCKIVTEGLDMIKDSIMKKAKGITLSKVEIYEAVEYLMKYGETDLSERFFLALLDFGMNKNEVYYLALALRDSGRVLHHDDLVLEKHSTGGVGDPSSVVLVPVIASLGYKIVKLAGRSYMFTNGSADRFGAISNFNTLLTDEEVKNVLDKTNAVILSHKGDICPADYKLFAIREKLGRVSDINLLAASIACKKLASGAQVVLIDIKYGLGSVVKTYKEAKKLAHLLKFIFSREGVNLITFITNAKEMIGFGIGNAVEVEDAVKVLRGERGLLRNIVCDFAVEMIKAVEPILNKKDIRDMVVAVLDNGTAYKKFLEIVSAQGGSAEVIENNKLFAPYNVAKFRSKRAGYVGPVDPLTLGEMTKRLCKHSHDGNIGARLHVKIGDYVRKGDVVITMYYKEPHEFSCCKNAVAGCVRLTSDKIKPIKVVKKVMR